MKEVAGDLIQLANEGKFDVIVHGCNCQCKMGGGIAKQIRQAFPEAHDADCGTAVCDPRKIGSFSFAKANVNNGKRLVIVNGYTQLLAGGQVNYHAVRKVMKQVKQNFYGKRIGYPMIGSGLAGGDWDRIKDIIEEELKDEDHTLVRLPPVGKKVSKTHASKSKKQKIDQQGDTTSSQRVTSSNTPAYIWKESLLEYLVGQLRDNHYSLPNTDEANVRENIGDLLLDEGFPQELTPTLQNPPGPVFMMQQGRYPPWVWEISPFVLERLNSKDPENDLTSMCSAIKPKPH